MQHRIEHERSTGRNQIRSFQSMIASSRGVIAAICGGRYFAHHGC